MVSIEKWVYPIPFRTRQSSTSSPMILHTFVWESRPMPRFSLERSSYDGLSFFKPNSQSPAVCRICTLRGFCCIREKRLGRGGTAGVRGWKSQKNSLEVRNCERRMAKTVSQERDIPPDEEMKNSWGRKKDNRMGIGEWTIYERSAVGSNCS